MTDMDRMPGSDCDIVHKILGGRGLFFCRKHQRPATECDYEHCGASTVPHGDYENSAFPPPTFHCDLNKGHDGDHRCGATGRRWNND